MKKLNKMVNWYMFEVEDDSYHGASVFYGLGMTAVASVLLALYVNFFS